MTKMYLAGVLLFLVGCYTTLAAICPTDWQRYGESCYLLITQQMNWTDAVDTCSRFGSSPVVPKTQQEHNYIWNSMTDFFDGNVKTSIWIGCSDLKEEGNWKPCPLSDKGKGFQNWNSKRLQNSIIHNCAGMAKMYGGKWAALRCNTRRLAACELPVDTTPELSLQTGPDGRIEFQCLVGHVMKELRADGVVSCGKACRSEPRCRSFNLLMEQGSRKMVCQLNNSTRHEAADGNMKARDECYFFDLKRLN